LFTGFIIREIGCISDLFFLALMDANDENTNRRE